MLSDAFGLSDWDTTRKNQLLVKTNSRKTLCISFCGGKRRIVRKTEMVERSIPAMDAWMREAGEASRLIDDLEIRIKNRSPDQLLGLKDSDKPKLLELGVKLDRLESLLLNPPSKPILYVFSPLDRPLCFSHWWPWYLEAGNGYRADSSFLRPSFPKLQEPC